MWDDPVIQDVMMREDTAVESYDFQWGEDGKERDEETYNCLKQINYERLIDRMVKRMKATTKPITSATHPSPFVMNEEIKQI
jgi:hypothetical protein